MIEVHGTDEQRPALFAALSEALGEIGPVVKDNEAGGRGGRTYKYADLTAVLDAIRPVLPTHGLWYSQNPGEIRPVANILVQSIESVIAHKDGAYIMYRTDLPMPEQTEQGMGKSTSYGRRYQAVGNWSVGMEDNDAQHSIASRVSAPPAASSAPTGHLAQAAMELGATPIARPSGFLDQLNALIEEMRATDTPYPSKGLLGAYFANNATLAAIKPGDVQEWAQNNPGATPMQLLQYAAEHARDALPAGNMKASTQAWLAANS